VPECRWFCFDQAQPGHGQCFFEYAVFDTAESRSLCVCGATPFTWLLRVSVTLAQGFTHLLGDSSIFATACLTLTFARRFKYFQRLVDTHFWSQRVSSCYSHKSYMRIRKHICRIGTISMVWMYLKTARRLTFSTWPSLTRIHYAILVVWDSIELVGLVVAMRTLDLLSELSWSGIIDYWWCFKTKE
jgi:hypothetical protein